MGQVVTVLQLQMVFGISTFPTILTNLCQLPNDDEAQSGMHIIIYNATKFSDQQPHSVVLIPQNS